MRKFAVVFVIITLTFLFLSFKHNVHAETNHVVISQIQILGTTAEDEFVELYNPTGNAVDLTGWRLGKKIFSGTLSNLVTTMSGTIPAYGYFLVTHPTDYTGSVLADLKYSSGGYSITANNTIILYSDAGTTVVDKVGFGSASDFEGSVFPTNPVTGGSLKRISNLDTDNNANDFTSVTVSDPKNSSYIEATSTSTPIETPTASPTPTQTPTEMPTASPTVTPTPTATPSPTANPTPKPLPARPVFLFIWRLMRLLLSFKF